MPDGDVLIHAGDATGLGDFYEIKAFADWLGHQPHKVKLVVAGNHDFGFENDVSARVCHDLMNSAGAIYLEDSGVQHLGVRFWGSPWTPEFYNWAFMLPRNGEAIAAKWNLIPEDVDVLITHGPPHGIMDIGHTGDHVGCERLRERVAVIHPKVHIFGHLHDSYGTHEEDGTRFFNVASCDDTYEVTHAPQVIDL